MLQQRRKIKVIHIESIPLPNKQERQDEGGGFGVVFGFCILMYLAFVVAGLHV